MFTDQGVVILSSVLNSPRAIAVNIEIMRAFVKLRVALGFRRGKMSQATNTVSSADAYKEFQDKLIPRLRGLAIPISFIRAETKQIPVGSANPPEEYFEIEANFPGAICSFSMTRSSVYPDCFGCRVKLNRDEEPTLSLSDYIVFQKLGTSDSLRFWLTDVSLSDGIDRIVNTIVSVFGSKLRAVLQGREWVTAPFDWGDYK